MKKIGFLVTACLVACGLFLTQSAFATITAPLIESDYDGTWTIDDPPGYTITFEIWGSTFGIYNPNDTDNLYELADGLNEITYDSTNGLFTILNCSNSTPESIDLGSSSFGIYLANEDGNIQSTVYDVYYLELSGYYLDFTGEGETDILISGAISGPPTSPVPLPTAALLLGSGLAGLVGFRRKIGQH